MQSLGKNSLLCLPVLLQEGMLGTEHRQRTERKEVGPPSFKVCQQTAAIFRDNIQEGVFEEKDLPLDVTEEILSPAPDYGNWNQQTNPFLPFSLKRTVRGQVSLHQTLARKYLGWGN